MTSSVLRFQGCLPANLVPFTADLRVDEPAYSSHLRWLADAEGVTGIVANGHASEVSSLSREERKRTPGTHGSETRMRRMPR